MSFLFSAALVAFTPVAPAQKAQDLLIVPQREHYPAEALAAKIEGDVPIMLQIAADGSLRCTIRDKSAPKALQRPSCLLVVQRWPYGPNIDSKGVAKPTTVPMLVYWRIPDPAKKARTDYGGAVPIAPARWIRNDDYPVAAIRKNVGGEVVISFDVSETGKFTNCAVTAQDSSLLTAACPAISKRAILLPAIDAAGVRRPTKGHMTVRFEMPQ
jgi:hypothetical protein